MEPVTINLSGAGDLGFIAAHLLAVIVLGLISRRHAMKAGVLFDSAKTNLAYSHVAGAIISGILMFINAIVVMALSVESSEKQAQTEMTMKYQIPEDAWASLEKVFQEQTELFTDQIDQVKAEVATRVLTHRAKEILEKYMSEPEVILKPYSSFSDYLIKEKSNGS